MLEPSPLLNIYPISPAVASHSQHQADRSAAEGFLCRSDAGESLSPSLGLQQGLMICKSFSSQLFRKS